MSRTITAMFDSRSEAEAARERLTASNIDASRVRIIDNQSSGTTGTTGSYGNTSESTEGRGFFSQLKELFVPDEDRHSFAEGIQRGGYLLTAEVDEDDADRACSILEESNSVDFDSREREWRDSDSWTGYAGAGSAMGARSAMTDSTYGSTTDTLGTGTTTGTTTGAGFASERGQTVAEEHIPIVEEELRIGKREVNRGGVRVRSYVREVPVHEQVTLREEHVDVERRPVNQPVSAAGLTGDVFQEKNIELTETSEEAVVAKEARVAEELVVKKTAEEHVETVDDTVRRTEVDVEGAENRSAFGSFGSDPDRPSSTTGSTGGSYSDTDLERTNRDRSGF